MDKRVSTQEVEKGATKAKPAWLNTFNLKRKELPHCAITEATQHNRLVTEGTSITIGIIGEPLRLVSLTVK